MKIIENNAFTKKLPKLALVPWKLPKITFLTRKLLNIVFILKSYQNNICIMKVTDGITTNVTEDKIYIVIVTKNNFSS